MLLNKLKSTLKNVTIKEADGSVEEFYRVEGDMLLDDDQLEIYALQQEALKKAKEHSR